MIAPSPQFAKLQNRFGCLFSPTIESADAVTLPMYCEFGRHRDSGFPACPDIRATRDCKLIRSSNVGGRLRFSRESHRRRRAGPLRLIDRLPPMTRFLAVLPRAACFRAALAAGCLGAFSAPDCSACCSDTDSLAASAAACQS